MIMPEILEARMIAPCGVNCLACSAHLDRKKPCPGCRSLSENITRKSCRNCAQKQCAFEQGYQWCFECSRFPCARIKSLDQRYREKYNINLIQNGLEVKRCMDDFLQSQKDFFTCKSCGGIIDQHLKRCSECGNHRAVGFAN